MSDTARSRTPRLLCSRLSCTILAVGTVVMLGTVFPQRAGTAFLRRGPQEPGTSGSAYYLPVVTRDVWQVPEIPFGVQVFWSSDPSWPYVIDRVVDEAAHAGASWMRIPLTWEWIEPQNTSPEGYFWPPELDALLSRAAARHLRVIFTLERNPAWAALWPGGPVYREPGSDMLGELLQFMQAAVARYGAPPYSVKHWEFYNEADNADPLLCLPPRSWGCFGSTPELYAQEMAAVYDVIKAQDPAAQLLFSGLAYDRWRSAEYPENPFIETFLDDVLAWFRDENGGEFPFDMMNFHYYPVFGAKWETLGLGPDIMGKAAYISGKLALFGAEKPIVCTETSMWSDSQNPPPWQGSDEQQSRYVAKVYARSQAAGLGFAIWYWLVDREDEYDKPGILHPDLSHKPSFAAYQTLTAQLTNSEYARTLDPAETGSQQIEAYQFRGRAAGGHTIVAWTNDESNHTLALAASRVALVDKYGVAWVVDDGDDGSVDGRVQITLGPSPIYVRVQ